MVSTKITITEPWQWFIAILYYLIPPAVLAVPVGLLWHPVIAIIVYVVALVLWYIRITYLYEKHHHEEP